MCVVVFVLVLPALAPALVVLRAEDDHSSLTPAGAE
eukprot:COSAG01_NODE_62789_length_283_cov_0.364130_1_plen_35_part_10